MATFTVDVRAAGLLSGLRNAEKRMAHAVANAINATARDIQHAEREKIKQKLTVRKTEFILRQVAVIKPFASVKKGVMHAQISIGARPRLLLRSIEQEHERVGQKALHRLGETGVAVPVIGGARPSKRSVVPEHYWIGKLKLKRPSRKKTSHLVPRGLLRTYMVPQVGIFQRTGNASTRMLWAFVPRVSKAKRFEFEATARRIVDMRFVPHLIREVNATLKHAFGKGLR